MQLAPIRPYVFVPTPVAQLSAAAKFSPEIAAKARELGLVVENEADDFHHSIRYVFGIADDDGAVADPLYTARGPHSALRFLDHYAARLHIV